MKPNTLIALVILGAGVGAWALFGNPPAAVEGPNGEPPAVRLKLVDEALSPLACRATLWRVGNGERQIWPGAGGVCVEGQLVWGALDQGAYRLMIQSPGRVLVDIDIDYVGEPIDLGDAVSPVGGIVRGVVLREGEHVYGAVLELPGGRRHAESGPDGTFAFPGVPLGEVVVRAALNGEGDVESVEVGASEPAELRMELEAVPSRGVLGLRFEIQSGAAVIREVHPAGPAAERLMVGDRVEAIDGAVLEAPTRQEVLRLLAGTPGEAVVLSIRRGGEVLGLELVRVSHFSL